MNVDWVIVGSGIVGLTLAREITRRFPGDKILILEKEKELAKHASGRNSGVLHAGIYYPPGTVKASLCVEGRRAMKAYCQERSLPLLEGGKVIVPKSEEEMSQIEKLAENARLNGVSGVEIIDTKCLLELEPFAFPASRALYSPVTAVISPKAVMQSMVSELQNFPNVHLLFHEGVVSIDSQTKTIQSRTMKISYGHLINAAGAFADKIAHSCGVGHRYRILPFRGSYFLLDPKSPLKIRSNIYPVPDLKVPFLGIHFTRSTSGEVYVGPSALPALGRVNYNLLKDIDWGELPSNLISLADSYLSNRQGLRHLMHKEVRQLSKGHFCATAKRLVPQLEMDHLLPSSKVGIRAQLMDLKSKQLLMDFHVENGKNSTHILNAVSPAFTCSIKFAEYVLDRYVCGNVSSKLGSSRPAEASL